MTSAQLEPFVGHAVAVTTTASDVAVTGTLERLGTGGATYQIVSVDGEIPPVVVDAAEIVRIVV